MKTILITALLSALLVPATLSANGNASGDAQTVSGAADAALGERMFDERCAVCHAGPAAVLDLLPAEAKTGRQAWLDAFLVDHYATEDDIRRGIIAWLLDR